jgi:hypothetical protein
VEGMGGNNSFFFCHEWPEARDGSMSCYNEVGFSVRVQSETPADYATITIA